MTVEKDSIPAVKVSVRDGVVFASNRCKAIRWIVFNDLHVALEQVELGRTVMIEDSPGNLDVFRQMIANRQRYLASQEGPG